MGGKSVNEFKDGTIDHRADCPKCPHNGKMARLGCKIKNRKDCSNVVPYKTGKRVHK